MRAIFAQSQPAMAPQLAVLGCGQKGLGLIAKRKFGTGDVIASMSDACWVGRINHSCNPNATWSDNAPCVAWFLEVNVLYVLDPRDLHV